MVQYRVRGLIGWLIVDPITGKMWKLPTEVTENMVEDKVVFGTAQRQLRIVTLDQVPANLRKSLVRLN